MMSILFVFLLCLLFRRLSMLDHILGKLVHHRLLSLSLRALSQKLRVLDLDSIDTSFEYAYFPKRLSFYLSITNVFLERVARCDKTGAKCIAFVFSIADQYDQTFWVLALVSMQEVDVSINGDHIGFSHLASS